MVYAKMEEVLRRAFYRDTAPTFSVLILRVWRK